MTYWHYYKIRSQILAPKGKISSQWLTYCSEISGFLEFSVKIPNLLVITFKHYNFCQQTKNDHSVVLSMLSLVLFESPLRREQIAIVLQVLLDMKSVLFGVEIT